jgi:hypothetical protein
MISIRLAASAAATAIIALLLTPPAVAAQIFFSGNGSGSACTAAAPCTLAQAVGTAVDGQELACADSSDNAVIGNIGITKSIVIDCAGTAATLGALSIEGSSSSVVVLRNLTVSIGTIFVGSGTAILDHVHIAGGQGATTRALLDVQALVPGVTVVVRNSVIENGGVGGASISAGVLNASASVRLDRVTIAGNAGGGLKIDTTSGPFTVDVTDSEISSNTGNGLNVVCPTGGPALLSISRGVIAKNGAAGVQTNGACAAALIDTTLFDSNASGATSIVNGGRIMTYGNNRLVNFPGSGFSGPTALQ